MWIWISYWLVDDLLTIHDHIQDILFSYCPWGIRGDTLTVWICLDAQDAVDLSRLAVVPYRPIGAFGGFSGFLAELLRCENRVFLVFHGNRFEVLRVSLSRWEKTPRSERSERWTLVFATKQHSLPQIPAVGSNGRTKGTKGTKGKGRFEDLIDLNWIHVLYPFYRLL